MAPSFLDLKDAENLDAASSSRKMSVRLGIDKMLPRQKPPDEILIKPSALQTRSASMMMDDELEVDETSTINARINTKWHTSLQTRHMQEWFKKAYEAQDDGDSSALLRWRINVGELVESRIAHVVLMLVVVANAAAIGFQTDWVQTRRLDDGGACGVINTLCLVVFTIEVVAKLFAFRAATFSDWWNNLDIMIVLVGIGYGLGHLAHGQNISALRLVRLLRIARLAEFSEQLEALTRAFLKGVHSVTWVVGLTVLFLYVYAVVGCELYYHSASEGVAADFEEATGVTLREYWGTVGRALLTLMQVMTFDSWADFVRPLVHATPVRSSLYFFSFIVLCSFMCEFMMSAVFTDTLIEIRQEEVVQRRNAHRKWLAHVKRCAAQLFTIADEDGSESLDRAEILRLLFIIQKRQALVDRDQPIPNDSLTEVMVEMAQHSINIEHTLRAVLDWLRDSSQVSVRDFVHCIAQSHEPPQKEDTWSLERRVSKVQADLDALREELNGKLDHLIARLPLAADGASKAAPSPPHSYAFGGMAPCGPSSAAEAVAPASGSAVKIIVE